MGTDKTRKEKIEWMKMAKKTKMAKVVILRNFVVKFSSTMNTAKEIYDLTEWEKAQRILK